MRRYILSKSCADIKMDPFLTQAAVNVGGIVLNALAIEHFILRHPCEPQQVCDEINIYLLDQTSSDFLFSIFLFS